ncbi:MAG TPA: hypothetical protein DCZ91_18155 [Lachnospiraceae bacterium]|nr:hypothetical protein [Lachnospiraceae bacterium]
MGRISRANLKKTIYYLKRNGLKRTWYAVRERLDEKKQLPYLWTPPSETELENQRRQWEEKGFSTVFSILVPAYRTKPEYLKELIESLLSQTYPKWELILADATEDDSVECVVRSILDSGASEADGTVIGGGILTGTVLDRGNDNTIGGNIPEHPDPRIRYIRLQQNAGIAENTNQALTFATGDYVGLLDHDDVLTENALYEMAAAIEEGRQQGCMPKMLYSDEDKCNGDRTEYYEPNFKEDFNLDLLLSNNYICHFLVMDRALIKRLKFRREFEGAQDYDLVLRAVAESGLAARPDAEKSIIHIPKVLYHWRCHPGSTAENPRSKLHAYEAGRRAIQDFADRAGWRAKAADTAHVGFYLLQYEGSLFDSRPDVGAVGGCVAGRRRGAGNSSLAGKKVLKGSGTMKGNPMPGGGFKHSVHIIGGRMAEDGTVYYENLPINYSGYLHRAILLQDAFAVDIRNICVRPECRELFRKVIGVPYQALPGTDFFDASVLPEDCDIRRVSLEFGRVMREAGYRIIYAYDQKQLSTKMYGE